MIDGLVAIIVDESRWLPAAMGIATLSVMFVLLSDRHRDTPASRRVLAAMNLFFGVTIATMAFGHLTAVTTKLAVGTLEGWAVRLYAIGAVLAVPAVFVIRHTRQVLAFDDHGRATIGLNAWLAFTLLVLGIHNAPLAAPAILNVGYHLHSRRFVGWIIVGAAVVLNVTLFIGSLIFMASGQTFEQFTGVD